MLRNILRVVVLIASVRACASWSMIQHKNNVSCSGTTCAVTVTSTGAGHAGIIMGIPGSSGITISSVSGGGTWTHPSSCAGSVIGVGSSDVAYNLSLSSGATTITVTWSSSNNGEAEFIEYSATNTPVTFDTCAAKNIVASLTNATGPSLTLTGTNDVIVSGGFFSGTVSGCTWSQAGTGGNPSDFPSGDAACGIINAMVGTAVTFTNTLSAAALSAIALTESSVTKNCTLAIMGVGSC